MRRFLAILVVLLVAIFLLYISRFWPVELWGRRSFLGELGLRPNGGLLAQWLRGSLLAPFELLIWVILGFLSLTAIEKITSWLNPNAGEN